MPTLSKIEAAIREAEGILNRNGCGIGGGYWARRYVRLLDARGYLHERSRRN